jgi:hypothetical protein
MVRAGSSVFSLGDLCGNDSSSTRLDSDSLPSAKPITQPGNEDKTKLVSRLTARPWSIKVPSAAAIHSLTLALAAGSRGSSREEVS